MSLFSLILAGALVYLIRKLIRHRADKIMREHMGPYPGLKKK